MDRDTAMFSIVALLTVVFVIWIILQNPAMVEPGNITAEQVEAELPFNIWLVLWVAIAIVIISIFVTHRHFFSREFAKLEAEL
jgi:hypothetical protein